MAEKTREEVAQEAIEANTKAGAEYADAQRSAAEEARANQPDVAETEEEYRARVQAASTTGIFGDTDTTAGAGANVTDVPSANNEAATVAVAEADAAPEDSEEADASTEEARRQVDISGVQPSAEEAQEGANEPAAEEEVAIEEAADQQEAAADADVPGDSTEAGPASDAGAEAGGSQEAPNADAAQEQAEV
jgi:hypothetical protein